MKILFLSDTYMQDGSFDPFRQEVLEILSSYGKETKAVITNHFLNTNSYNIFSSYEFNKVLKMLKEFNPDIVFSINRAGLVKSLTKTLSPEVVKISWFVDSYERIPDSLLKFTGNDVVWLTGKDSYEQNFSEKYQFPLEKIVTVPFASNTNVFYPKNKDRIIDGCFVGTAFSNETFINTLDNLCKDTSQTEIFLSVFKAHKEKYIFDLQTALKEKGFLQYAIKDRDDWQRIFDDQISIEKRVQLLSVLNEFNMKIYGEPDRLWISYLSIAESNMLDKYQYKPIKTSTELSNLYNISKIGVNIQHHQASNHSLPIRVFDLMACKTLLLTEKNSINPLNQIGFIENVDFICFKNKKDLRDKFEFYINHEDERCKIVDSAYLKVSKYHNLRFRIQSSLSHSLQNSDDLTFNSDGSLEILSKPKNLKKIGLQKRSKYLTALKKRFPRIWNLLKLILTTR